MAPKRKLQNPAAVAGITTRVTRSSSRRDNGTVVPPAADPKPSKQKKSKTSTTSAVEIGVPPSPTEKKSASEPETVAPPAGDPKISKKKKSKTSPAAAAVEKESETDAPPSAAEVKKSTPPDGSKTVIIEHCKQCNSFKTRAIQVKSGLEKGVKGINVLVNPEKPRRGCFEIREEGGDIFVSLLDLKRPFQKMKDLDMEKVISDIVEKIK